jgi:hypothetical protein
MCTKNSTDPKLEEEEYMLELGSMVLDYKNQHQQFGRMVLHARHGHGTYCTSISRHIVERASGVLACALAASHKPAAGGMRV